jgi:hypothetical protein
MSFPISTFRPGSPCRTEGIDPFDLRLPPEPQAVDLDWPGWNRSGQRLVYSDK